MTPKDFFEITEQDFDEAMAVFKRAFFNAQYLGRVPQEVWVNRAMVTDDPRYIHVQCASAAILSLTRSLAKLWPHTQVTAVTFGLGCDKERVDRAVINLLAGRILLESGESMHVG